MLHLAKEGLRLRKALPALAFDSKTLCSKGSFGFVPSPIGAKRLPRRAAAARIERPGPNPPKAAGS